jgi:aspartate kinase
MLNMELGAKYNFIAQLADKNRLELLFNSLKEREQITAFHIDTKISIVSVVGYGISNDNNVIGTILHKLDEKSIAVSMVQSSEIKISLLINDDDNERAISILHELFELDK